MAKDKVTVTLDPEALRGVRALVAEGKARSVSAFVQHAVHVALQDVAGWAAALEQALEDSGGPMTAGERAWADRVLGVTPGRQRGRRRSRAA